MKKNYKGSVFAQKSSSGKKLLYYKSPYLNNKRTATGLEDTKFNRRAVIDILKKLEYQHELGTAPKEIRIDINKLFNQYINYCVETKGLQYNTIRSYKYAFNTLISENFWIDEKIKHGSKEIYYFEYRISERLSELDISPTSKNIMLRSIGTFINWLDEEEYLPFFNYKKYFKKEIKKKIETFSQEEINIILEYIKNKNIKVYYVLMFMALTGTRGKETLEIKFSDIDLKNKTLSIPNKTRKDIIQTIPLRDQAIDIIELMRIDVERRYKNQDKLFDYNVSSVRYISKVLTDAMNEHNINKNVKLHAFRKYFATQIINSGISPYKAQKLMRHSDIRTTMNHYYKQDTDELKKLIDEIPAI